MIYKTCFVAFGKRKLCCRIRIFITSYTIIYNYNTNGYLPTDWCLTAGAIEGLLKSPRASQRALYRIEGGLREGGLLNLAPSIMLRDASSLLDNKYNFFFKPGTSSLNYGAGIIIN